MDRIELTNRIESADVKICRDALTALLSVHASPIFGAAKSIEHELAALTVLQQLGFLSAKPDEYELVLSLRVTKAKARALLYQAALRQLRSTEEIDRELRALLANPRVTKEGASVFVEVPDPLLMDCLRQRVRQLGYISDGSFSGSVAKIPERALGALVTDLIPESDRGAIGDRLRKQGVPGSNLASLVTGAIGALGRHAAGAAGERIGDKLGDFFVDGAIQAFDWVRSAHRDRAG